MKGKKTIKPIQRDAGKVVSVRIKTEMAEALKIIGNGKTATAINNVLDTFKEEIYQAAKNAKKAS